jgi:isopentenyl-diphosphate delta-isomerase
MDEIVGRKADHMRLATVEAALARGGPGFDDVAFVHDALPEVDFDRLDPSVGFLGRRLSLPLVIASMTGGHPDGGRVNGALARAAERHGLAMGVGSQRAALREPALADTYTIARREAPAAFLMANVGAPQLVAQGDAAPLSIDDVKRLAEMISADAVIVHLNALQELIMPEGDRRAFGWLAAIERLAAALPLPVVAKETGGGVSEPVARRLAEAGVAAIDVGGRGGTSFAAIEGLRATEQGDRRGSGLAERFADGGIRSGLDAARAIALGATAVGVARPLLQAFLDGGDDALDAWVAGFREELLATQFLTGSATIADLAQARVVVSGATGQWLQTLS